MNRRRFLGAAAMVLVAAAACWFWPDEPAAATPVTVAAPIEAVPAQPRNAPPAAVPADGGTPAPVCLWVIAADTGAPIAGARVVQQGHLGAVLSDDRGAVRADWPETVELRVAATFMEPRTGTFRRGDTVELERLPPVRGEVLERTDGPEKVRPVAGAEVTTMEPPFAQTVTGADGRFELTGIAVPFGRLAARKGDRFGVGQYGEPVAPDDVVVFLEPARYVDGTVVDGKAQPLEGVAVSWSAGTIFEQSLTGPDGKWRVPQWERKVFVRATKAGYLPYESRPATHPTRSPVRTVIRLDKPASLSGVVQTPDGRFVNGATVEAASVTMLSGPEGRFAFTGLTPRTNEVNATLGEREGSTPVVLSEGANPPVVVVIAPELTDVPLRLVDGNGDERTCLSATATPVPAEGWSSDYVHDRKALPLRAGRFRIEVTADDDHLADETVDVRPPAPLTLTVHRDPSAEVEPEAQSLTVRVKTPSGVGVGGATVQCGSTKGETREDGRFDCVLPPYGDRPVYVTAKKGLTAGMTPAWGPERTLDVVVRPARTLKGKITGLSPGMHSLTAWSVFGSSITLFSGAEFALADRFPVRTLLCVNAGEERLGCTVAEDEAEVTIAVGPRGAFTVIVLDEKGAPIEHPIISVSRQPFTPLAPSGVATVSSPPGTYVVVVNANGTRARAEALVTIRPGETTQVGTLRLK